MAYRIVKDATAWWPVRWLEAAGDADVVERSIDVRFARVGNAEFRTLFIGDLTVPAEERKTATNEELWARVVRGWRGLVDEAGADLAMTDDAVAAMLDVPNFPEALGAAYLAFFRALPETRLGNSSASPAGGPAAAGPTDATPTPTAPV